jgi:hypothetical protein
MRAARRRLLEPAEALDARNHVRGVSGGLAVLRICQCRKTLSHSTTLPPLSHTPYPSPYMSYPAASSLSPDPAWVWALDEAAIRNDGGAAGLAAAVDGQQAQQHPYVPPTVAYERVLWEATRTAELSSSPAPVNVAASAGWILPRAADTPPVFIAHTMLAAVWLLRQSLPDGAVTPSAWAQLAQAASATAKSPSPKPGRTKRTRASSTAAAASASHDDDDVSSSAEEGAPLSHQHASDGRSHNNTPPTVTTVTTVTRLDGARPQRPCCRARRTSFHLACRRANRGLDHQAAGWAARLL